MKVLLQTDTITKRYGAILVTDKVSLDVKEGELHAIIGPNGAGKTTLINQLSGELRSDSGRIRFGDEDVTALGINARARMGLVRSYQITSVFDEFTVLENATLAALGARTHAFKFWRSLLGDREALVAAREGIEAAGLNTRIDAPASELGYGERRQLELAMALAARPKFLLLDEPMAGMSVQESGAVVALLKSLKRKYTILLVEHDMNAVFALADRISVLVYGRLMVTGTPEEIRGNAEVRAIYLGEEEIA
ncbi:ABC transporter ATP-binding protein [Rhodoferax sp.]|uniref:ABC transporter ATP-binding protein n=1 Tax=Rhodoferax sp. TaxID=50421 RepID=UPI0025F61CC1|nr:ABC transporter ATP-binding protein [Rhodoferax sp.]MCM2339750.1 ABC transporter ATP-binding protein [Rhodoferax sp.]